MRIHIHVPAAEESSRIGHTRGPSHSGGGTCGGGPPASASGHRSAATRRPRGGRGNAPRFAGARVRVGAGRRVRARSHAPQDL